MLVLSRKKNESIRINDDITIVVVEIRSDKVRLGVEAPKETPVHRDEVYQAVKEKYGVVKSKDVMRAEAAAQQTSEPTTQGTNDDELNAIG